MASNALECLGPVPRGRPSLYSDELAAEICERLTEGESLLQICRDDHMPSRWTVAKWAAEHPVFSQQYGRAREIQADHEADVVTEIADNLGLLPEHKRLMIDTRKWRAERMGRATWGTKVEHDHAIALRPAASEGELPEGIGFLRGFLHGGTDAAGPGPDPGSVGEK